MSFYQNQAILFIRALTPIHVGVGRIYAGYVDLPVQRDEFNYPTIWASSLKGAIKANTKNNVSKCFGKEPDEEGVELEYAQSHLVVTDARLFLIPTRVLKGIYTYLTSPHLLNYLYQYLRVVKKTEIEIDKSIRNKLEQGISIVSKQELLEKNEIVVNETRLRAEFDSDLITKLKLKDLLPSDILSEINSRGLVIVPDHSNTSLNIVNKSMMIQYRVRLKKDTKTVDEGPWSEEYIPSETLFVSIILCSGREITIKSSSGGVDKVKCNLETIKKSLENLGYTIFIGGKETIGKGLVKLYLESK